KEILEKIKNQEIDVDQALSFIEQQEYCIDYDRKQRTGVPEVIYGAGKNVKQIEKIINQMLKHDQNQIIVTRVSQEKYDTLKNKFPAFTYEPVSQMFYYEKESLPLNKGKIAVICAGTSDLYVANEAAITARLLGNEVIQINDVGVAGLHRLLNRLDDLQNAHVIVVVAGMEGALASVVGGLVKAPVIAVPTSVGYGASFQGLSALLSMLNSCASGVSVVNIDNGFGAGYMAHSINCLGGKRK
ncbi:MAG: nickel pincer cofactor biosynthesis protein LarB, partial [Faecalibacillus sp.]